MGRGRSSGCPDRALRGPASLRFAGFAAMLVLCACGRYGYEPLDADAAGEPMPDVDSGEPAEVVLRFQDGLAPDPAYAGTRDTHIIEDAPADNFGTLAILSVDGSEPPSSLLDMHALIRWELDAVPPGVTVQAAAITLEIVDASSEPDERYTLVEALRPWVEREATWEEFASGQAWEQPGAAGALDTGVESLGELMTDQVGPLTVPLNGAGVAVVQRWCDEPASNHGLLLRGPDNIDGLDASSRESATPQHRPILELRYTP